MEDLLTLRTSHGNGQLKCELVWALAYRKEYSTTVSTTITSWKRYEYDGINLLRVDEKYDTAGGTIDANDPWRTLEVSTHRPGMLGNLLGKRFYLHTNNDATPDGTYDYFYGYDRVGNLVFVYEGGGSGDEAFYFTQDAFGNQLALGNFNGDSWSTARGVGVTEHQTGKWLDPFTGMYYFYARWYDSEVGRFVGRARMPSHIEGSYEYCVNLPTSLFDPDGFQAFPIDGTWPPPPRPRYRPPNFPGPYNPYAYGPACYGFWFGYYRYYPRWFVDLWFVLVEYVGQPIERNLQGCDFWGQYRERYNIMTAGRSGNGEGGRINPEDIAVGMTGFDKGRCCRECHPPMGYQ